MFLEEFDNNEYKFDDDNDVEYDGKVDNLVGWCFYFGMICMVCVFIWWRGWKEII